MPKKTSTTESQGKRRCRFIGSSSDTDNGAILPPQDTQQPQASGSGLSKTSSKQRKGTVAPQRNKVLRNYCDSDHDFVKKNPNDFAKAICKRCKVACTRNAGSPTVMKNHLQLFHHEEYQQYLREMAKSATSKPQPIRHFEVLQAASL